MQDLRSAFRQVVKYPGFTAVVVVSLALGIGANTMIFSLVNGLLLRALPYANAERVVMLWFTPPNRPEQRQGATHANCRALRRPLQSFEHVGCTVTYVGTNLSEEGPDAMAPERLVGQEYTADLPQAFGVSPVIGRWFTVEEEQQGREPVIVISNRLWQRRFGGSPDVLGKKVHVTFLFTQSVASEIATIIGVAPQGFDFFNPESDFWFPFVVPAGAEDSPTRRLIVAGRLKPGVTLAQAQAEMSGVAAGLAKDVPQTNKDWGIQLQPVQEAYLGGLQNPLFTLEGVVAFVLLIACANVAGLLLAQGATQHKELAIRAALGSGRWRLVRQLLTGNVVLAVMGGILGLALGWAGMRILVSSLPPGFPRINEIAIDTTVLAFTLALSVLTGLVFGILPALQVSRPDLMEALRDSTRSATAGKAHQRLRSGFVVVQIALALVLLVGAGLMINSFLRLYAVDVGFDTRNLTTFQIQLLDKRFLPDTGRATAAGPPETEITPLFAQEATQIQERVAAIPGVQSASIVLVSPPLSGGARRSNFTIQGKPAAEAEQEAQSAEWYAIADRYFETLDVPVLRGREFNQQDSRAGLPVAVINATMAKRLWPNEDPIGRQIQVVFYGDQPRQVVGVVGDVRQNSRQQDAQNQIYVPLTQLPPVTTKAMTSNLWMVTFVVRSAGNPEQMNTAFRSAVADVDRSQPVFNMRTIEQILSSQMEGYRQFVLLLGVFGAVALILAIVGIYGIMAHSVTQRTSEIGIRMALGARSGQVLRLILRRGVVLVAIGLVVGAGASLALTRVIRTFLWGVTATDPLTFGLVVVGLAFFAMLACYIPSRRALKVDPISALRYE